MVNGLGTNSFVWGTNAEWFEQNGSQQKWKDSYHELSTLRLGTNVSHRERNSLV